MKRLSQTRSTSSSLARGFRLVKRSTSRGLEGRLPAIIYSLLNRLRGVGGVAPRYSPSSALTRSAVGLIPNSWSGKAVYVSYAPVIPSSFRPQLIGCRCGDMEVGGEVTHRGAVEEMGTRPLTERCVGIRISSTEHVHEIHNPLLRRDGDSPCLTDAVARLPSNRFRV